MTGVVSVTATKPKARYICGTCDAGHVINRDTPHEILGAYHAALACQDRARRARPPSSWPRQLPVPVR